MGIRGRSWNGDTLKQVYMSGNGASLQVLISGLNFRIKDFYIVFIQTFHCIKLKFQQGTQWLNSLSS